MCSAAVLWQVRPTPGRTSLALPTSHRQVDFEREIQSVILSH